MASTPMATPLRIRPVTAPPGEAATAAPLSPGMNAPDATTWWLPTGWEVATGFEDVDVPGAWLETVVAGADDEGVTEPDVDDAGAELTDTAPVDAVVDDESDTLACVRCDEPDEQAAPPRATMTSSARSFTAAHLRAPARWF